MTNDPNLMSPLLLFLGAMFMPRLTLAWVCFYLGFITTGFFILIIMIIGALARADNEKDDEDKTRAERLRDKRNEYRKY